MRLTVDEVVHHDDVVRLVIVWTRSNATADDSDAGDPRVVELDPEERKASIARRSRDKTAEQQTTISAEKLHQGTGATVTVFGTRTTAVRLVHVSENRTEAGDRRSRSPV